MTCEEHMVSCGMGSAVCELLATRHPVPVELVGLRSFGTSAPGDVLLDHFGLDAFSIAAAARAAIAHLSCLAPSNRLFVTWILDMLAPAPDAGLQN